MFEHIVQVPDLKMIAFADSQGLVPHARLGLHPEGDG
jgi:hypothetical protein